MEDFALRSSWGLMLARASTGDISLVIALICILFLVAGLYLLVALQNYIGAAVAVLLAVIIAVFFVL
jgi:hypothetical protein